MNPGNIYKSRTPGEESKVYLETATGSLLSPEGTKHSQQEFDELVPMIAIPSGYGVWNETDKRTRSYSGNETLIWEEDYCTWLSSDRGYFGSLQAWKRSASAEDIETFDFSPEEEFSFRDISASLYFSDKVADSVKSGSIKVFFYGENGAVPLKDIEDLRGLVFCFKRVGSMVKGILPTGDEYLFNYKELKNVHDSISSLDKNDGVGKVSKTPREFINQVFTLWNQGMLEVTVKKGYAGFFRKEKIKNTKSFFQDIKNCIQYEPVKDKLQFRTQEGSVFRILLSEAEEKTCYLKTSSTWSKKGVIHEKSNFYSS